MSSSLWHFHVLECFIARTANNRGRSLNMCVKRAREKMLQSSHWFRRLQILQLVVWTLLLNCCNIIYDFLGSFKHFIFFLCMLTLIMVFMSLSSVFVVLLFQIFMIYGGFLFLTPRRYCFIFLPRYTPSNVELDSERRCRRPADIDRTPASFPCTRCTSYVSSCALRVMTKQTFSCHRCRAFLRLQSAKKKEELLKKFS